MGKARDAHDAARVRRKAMALREIVQSGNVAEVARRCGVTDQTVRRWQKVDEDFAGQWRAALAAYETRRIERLAGAHVKPTRFGADQQVALLDGIAATRSVKMAAGAVGMHPDTVWAFAGRDPAFAAALIRAVRHGYVQVEAQLISDCINGKEPLDDETRERVSDAVRAGMVRAAATKMGAYDAAVSDEAERDRNEALAARWIARMLKIIREGV